MVNRSQARIKLTILKTITVLSSLSFDPLIQIEPIVIKNPYAKFYSQTTLEKLESTMDYNYITTEKFIQQNLMKYQDILP